MKRWAAVLLIFALFYFSSDFFSVGSISCPLHNEDAIPLSGDVAIALSQPYHYLGKGKQAYAFESADGKWVLKFFKEKYFKVPFWAAAFPKEKTKREKRRKFYQESYGIAFKMLREETGLVFFHQGLSSSPLPQLSAFDKMGRSHRIDLNEIPFVLQKRAKPLFPALKDLTPEELDLAIGQFLSLIATRIDLLISDGDHNVENNFGMQEGRIVHIDPGRLYLEEALWNPEKLKHEWWSATHQFRKWLEKNYPDQLISFDERIETNQQKVLQRSQASLSLQTDESPQVRSPVS